MFTKPKNIDTAFRQIRLFTLVVIIGCLFFSGLTLYKSQQLAASLQQKIYILSNGKVLEALATDRRDNIIVEAKDHIATFHRYFFTLDPDEKAITSTTTKALYLADASAKRQYDNLTESNYYSNIIAGNISQEISMDSVSIDVQQNPFYFRYYGRQQLTRTGSIVTRKLITEGYLRQVSRSENNPHGFLIESWKTMENTDINVQNR
ncbi:conjugative transposon TraK protein [Algoriphagus ratkowskyi]|uniref:Conjugative transposon TraK protein n=1 Tax=Algoriphagus ratkowskyi TaxID=57028 RepID=A0A2W7QWF0_9BACT|nr:conjugative transposon protein TraK [Algoriphagus ratkowskyi]PZX51506.1 conjugative transposon TraK protein [Algoriphagus ratkowskyi]TXD78789.1 conjugative transposon protein TraK [Algoriphagus ratkowskyi]